MDAQVRYSYALGFTDGTVEDLGHSLRYARAEAAAHGDQAALLRRKTTIRTGRWKPVDGGDTCGTSRTPPTAR